MFGEPPKPILPHPPGIQYVRASKTSFFSICERSQVTRD